MPNEKILVKYRTWHLGLPPRPIRMPVPGWAGDHKKHDNGCTAQAWHCPPFVEGSTYGLELVYPFEQETRVTFDGKKINFEGDFEGQEVWPKKGPPFDSFASHHYGMTSCLDILPPEGHVLRLETHPRFYTDTVGDVPCALAGHIRRFWPKIFFVVFKAPWPGQTHVFRKGEPYAKVLIVPEKVSYEVEKMSDDEANARDALDHEMVTAAPLIHRNKFTTGDTKLTFDDKYRQLLGVYNREGADGVKRYVRSCYQKVRSKPPLRPAKVIGHRRKRREKPEDRQAEAEGPADLHSGHTGRPPETQSPTPVAH
jgi:hypothetical protein